MSYLSINILIIFVFTSTTIAYYSVSVNVKTQVSSKSTLSTQFNSANYDLLSFNQQNIRDITSTKLVNNNNEPVTQSLITGSVTNNSSNGFEILIETKNYYNGKNYLLKAGDSISDLQNRIGYLVSCSLDTSSATSLYNNNYQTNNQNTKSFTCLSSSATPLHPAENATSDLNFSVNITLDENTVNNISKLFANYHYTDTITITHVDK